jgi:hypothetical protein
LPRGEILSLEQLWALAQRWYANRMDPHFQGRSAAEAEQLFREMGLTSAFWQATPAQ